MSRERETVAEKLGYEPKRGPLNEQEKIYIRDNSSVLSVEKIAVNLKRNPEVVEKYVRKEGIQSFSTTPAVEEAKGSTEAAKFRNDLRESRAWKSLKEKFSGEELAFFEERWVALMRQFQNDIFASEEPQLMRAIECEVLIDRNLKTRNKVVQEIAQLEVMQEQILSECGGDPRQLGDEERHTLNRLTGRLDAMRADEGAKTKEYLALNDAHMELMGKLKATREQRISKLDNQKVSYIELIKSLLDQDTRELESRQLALMREAQQKEKARLGALHEYMDGNHDRPILNADTAKDN